MGNVTSAEANQLANDFLALAKAVADYRFTNWSSLSKKEKTELGNLQDRLLDQGEKILALSVELVMAEAGDALRSITTLTNKIESTLSKLKDVQKVINIAAAFVTVGSAIIKKDMKAMGEGMGELAKNMKQELPGGSGKS
ncbi:MAG TPA: hypothetical protein VF610_07040 [Segetibacter sp.]